ncbi:unnamed protein product [Medioppia subpectinata]|uniref:Golgin subfamily A member 7/ERF4 domain-containing protein n=1 Tax=Medioppia subpectinata TaxID=1979941 RepID=A0A7R9KR93_9ACAR|nr:unnamed protein product [Medioppia subpectinata]CAG2108235.1 unnamed protein product [Medioppia subpectinata]
MAQALAQQAFDEIIEEIESNNSGNSNGLSDLCQTLEPIVIRGNGNITLFGLSNGFTDSFPSTLLGRVSREEFESTVHRINALLRAQHSTNAKLLILGCLCCCCSLGCSLLWPTLALSKRTKNSLEKVCNHPIM